MLRYNAWDLPALVAGSWGLGPLGGAGWLEVRFPSLVPVLGIGLWAGLVFGWCRDLSRLKALAIASTGAAVVAYPLIVLGRSGFTVGSGFQPRYALPLVILFTGLCLLPTRGRAEGLTRPQWAAAVAALSLANAVALHVQLRRYVTGVDVGALDLDAGREWWWEMPVSPNALWAIGVAAFTVAAALVLRSLADGDVSRRARADPGPAG